MIGYVLTYHYKIGRKFQQEDKIKPTESIILVNKSNNWMFQYDIIPTCSSEISTLTN